LFNKNKSTKTIETTTIGILDEEMKTNNKPPTFAALLFTRASGYGWIYETAVPTGWILLIILTGIFICSLPYFRRNGYFKVGNFF
jgi:hypothetical protein